MLLLETPQGPITESNAICRYLAGQSSKGLYPAPLDGGIDIRGAIDAWVDWAEEVQARLSDVVAPLWWGLKPGADEKEAKKVLLNDLLTRWHLKLRVDA